MTEDQFDPITHYPMWQKLDAILTHEPEKFDMESWGNFKPDPDDQYGQNQITLGSNAEMEKIKWAESCTTSMCLAGHVAALNGYHPVRLDGSALSWSSVSEISGAKEGDPGVRDIGEVGAEGLGISLDIASQLFYAEPEFVKDVVRAVTEGLRPLAAIDKTMAEWEVVEIPQF